MSITVGKIMFSSQDLTNMFTQVERHYLERIHALEEDIKDLKGCKRTDGWVGQTNETCKSGD